MTIGDNIKKYRKAKKMTQKELGEKIGKKEITIRRYEKGDITPPVPIINSLSIVLDIPVTKLLSTYDTDDSNINMLNRTLINMVGEDVFTEVSIKNQINIENYINYLKTLIPDEISIDTDLNSLSFDDKKILFNAFIDNTELNIKALLYDQSNKNDK